MQKTRSRLIKAALVAVFAVAAMSTQAIGQTTYPKKITGTTVTISSGGLQRTFIVHIPPTPKSSPGAVMLFHGGSIGTAAQIQALTLMDNLADRDGFYSVYPQALNGHWTDGRESNAGGANDVQFVKDIVAYLQKTYGVSSSKIFSAGQSNGGIMQYQLACAAPGLMRAVAPVAAVMTQNQRTTCSTAKITPMMTFMGTSDPYMPYGGGFPSLVMGKVTTTITKPAGYQITGQDDSFVSAPETAAYWAGVNGCKSSTSTNMPDKSSDGTSVTKMDYADCTSGGGTTLYTVVNGGHTWPGSTVRAGISSVGLTTLDISANEEMIAFFKKFGL
jgi:polyhydroxybutyrate depolymerase